MVRWRLVGVTWLCLFGLGCSAVPRLERFAATLPYEAEQTAYRWTNWFLRLPDETARFAQRAAAGFGAAPVYTTAPMYPPPTTEPVPPESAPFPGY